MFNLKETYVANKSFEHVSLQYYAVIVIKKENDIKKIKV